MGLALGILLLATPANAAKTLLKLWRALCSPSRQKNGERSKTCGAPSTYVFKEDRPGWKSLRASGQFKCQWDDDYKAPSQPDKVCQMLTQLKREELARAKTTDGDRRRMASIFREPLAQYR